MKFIIAGLKGGEVQNFVSDFYELDICRMANLQIEPDEERTHFRIVLEPESHSVHTMQALFRDGMMKHWGWASKSKEN